MPKLYFLDTGLRNFALRNFGEISFRPDKGPLFENAIFGELYKNLDVIEQLYFWRTLAKTEADFILIGDQKWVFEAKLTRNQLLKQPAGLRAFSKIYPDFQQVVVTLDRFASNDEIFYLPGWMI